MDLVPFDRPWHAAPMTPRTLAKDRLFHHQQAMAAIVALMVLGSACSRNPTPSPLDASPQPQASVPKQAPAAVIPTKKAEDLDVEDLRRTMKCPGGGFKDACTFLQEFESGTAWNLDNIRGTDGRYFGLARVYSQGKSEPKYHFMVVKKVPTNDVGPNDLPIKIALRELEASLGPELTHAPKLLRLVERSDGIPRQNRTNEYILKYAPSSWDGASRSAGASTVLHSSGGILVREGKNRSLLVIRLSPQSAGSMPGDGLYATLWPLSW